MSIFVGIYEHEGFFEVSYLIFGQSMLRLPNKPVHIPLSGLHYIDESRNSKVRQRGRWLHAKDTLLDVAMVEYRVSVPVTDDFN